ncbi:MAG: ribonuclease HI [Planctomycetes bacterium]|nr:ribonuclease HI [Planctomycetota bacterium]
MDKVVIYCDGSCSPNPGNGGWAAVLLAPGHKKRREISGAEVKTTNNRMEILAAVRALEQLTKPSDVTLYTDSRYLCDALAKRWIVKWQANGWLTTLKEPVKNQDLWEQVLALTAKHTVALKWLKGHADNTEINRCDELANAARRGL